MASTAEAARSEATQRREQGCHCPGPGVTICMRARSLMYSEGTRQMAGTLRGRGDLARWVRVNREKCGCRCCVAFFDLKRCK